MNILLIYINYIDKKWEIEGCYLYISMIHFPTSVYLKISQACVCVCQSVCSCVRACVRLSSYRCFKLCCTHSTYVLPRMYVRTSTNERTHFHECISVLTHPFSNLHSPNHFVSHSHSYIEVLSFTFFHSQFK